RPRFVLTLLHVLLSAFPSSSARMARPPRPTPFPYTTLFRSLAADSVRRPRGGHIAQRHIARAARLQQRLGRDVLARRGRHRARRDRKSTRLNSSHVAISHAVFCLKKKDRQIVGKGRRSAVER